MKQQTTYNKQLFKFLLVFLTISFYCNDLYAQQPFGVPYYSNCYQMVSGNLNGVNNKFRFLSNTNGRTIQMTSSNPLDIIGFDVYYKKTI